MSTMQKATHILIGLSALFHFSSYSANEIDLRQVGWYAPGCPKIRIANLTNQLFTVELFFKDQRWASSYKTVLRAREEEYWPGLGNCAWAIGEVEVTGIEYQKRK